MQNQVRFNRVLEKVPEKVPVAAAGAATATCCCCCCCCCCCWLVAAGLLLLACHGNTRSRVYGERVLRSYITWYGDWNLVTTIFSLCRIRDLLQNGGITSGNDVSYYVFDYFLDFA